MIKALVVDDNPLYLHSVSSILDELDYDYTCCHNGLLAKNKLTEDPTYNLVITDIVMPEIDGLELAKDIRDSHSFDKVHIIAMSSGASTISRNIALSSALLYANQTLDKPFSKQELLNKLDIAQKCLSNEQD